MTRITVDRSSCELNGICAAMAPEVFDFDETGLVLVNAEIPEDRIATMVDVVGSCPMAALALEDTE